MHYAGELHEATYLCLLSRRPAIPSRVETANSLQALNSFGANAAVQLTNSCIELARRNFVDDSGKCVTTGVKAENSFFDVLIRPISGIVERRTTDWGHSAERASHRLEVQRYPRVGNRFLPSVSSVSHQKILMAASSGPHNQALNILRSPPLICGKYGEGPHRRAS